MVTTENVIPLDPEDTAFSRPAPVRVEILEESPLLIAGLFAMLKPYAQRITLVTAALGSDDAERPDVLLGDPVADGSFGDGDGGREIWQTELDRLVELARTRDTRLAVFSWHANHDPLIQAAHAAGVSDIIWKGGSADQIVAAVEAVPVTYRGDPTNHDVNGSTTTQDRRIEELSIRETEILDLIVDGLSNDEIARRLYLSINTVKTYIRSAYRKIGVMRRSQAVLWAYERGLGHSSAPLPDDKPKATRRET